jgi:hypothetical protein
MTPEPHPHLAALEGALDRLTHQPWTRARGAWARDGHGNPVCPTSKRAETFCVLGDVLRHVGLTQKEAEDGLASSAARAPLMATYLGALSALRWTDHHLTTAKVGKHIDALSDEDAAAFVRDAITREQARLLPKATP